MALKSMAPILGFILELASVVNNLFKLGWAIGKALKTTPTDRRERARKRRKRAEDAFGKRESKRVP